VRRFKRSLVAVLACTALVCGVADARVADKAKKISTDKYAKTLCGVYVKAMATMNGFVAGYNAISAPDNGGLQTQTVSLATDLLTSFAQYQAKLKNVYPDVDGGKKINKLFVANLNGLTDKISNALDTFKAADPNNPAFIGDSTVFESAVNVATATLSDPFSKVKDQDLLGAFGDEKSCKNVVTVFGG
jgi:hypothetical protein